MTNPYAPPPGGGFNSRSGSDLALGPQKQRPVKQHKPARRFSVNRVQTPELNDDQRARFLRSRRNTRLTVFAALLIPLLLLSWWGMTRTGVWLSTNRGVNESSSENYEAALERFESARGYDVDTQLERQLYNIGTTHLNLLEYPDAVRLLDDALDADPGEDAEFTCKAYINLVHSHTGNGQTLASEANGYAADALALEDDIAGGYELETGDLTPEDLRNMADAHFEEAAEHFGLAQETIPFRREACDEADPPQSQQEQDQRDQEQEQELEDLENQRQDAEDGMSEPPERPEEDEEDDEQTEEERRQEELEERNNEAQQNREDEQESQNGEGGEGPDWDEEDDDDDDDDDGGGGSDRTPQW